MIARRWPQITLAAVAIAFAAALRVAVSGHDYVRTAHAIVVVALVAAGLGAVVLAVWALLPRARVFGAVNAAALTLAAALLAAAPVDFGYDDGCNDHGTVAPLALVPALAVVRPGHAVGAYEEWSTLVACPGADAAPPPLSQ